MNKYIDADKVIDYANQEVTAAFYYPQDNQEWRKRDEQSYREKWAFVKQVMINMPAADVAPQWTPVTDGLPEIGDRVLVTIPSIGETFVTIGTYAGEYRWYISDYGFCEKVIAWSSIPSPYKGGEQNA